jgi:hypothetical protein
VKILFMSAYRNEEIEDYRFRLAPGGLFLDKPFTIPALEQAVRAALNHPAPGPRPRAQ